MLDTNIFNRVCDGAISLGLLAERRPIATGVQPAELRATADAERREALLAIFHVIAPDLVPASSFCFDIPGAGWDEAEWNDGTDRFQKMLARLVCLDLESGRHKSQSGDRLLKNQISDIVIAETAIKAGVSLISADGNLRKVVKEFGGSSLSLDEMRAEASE
jgi:hypothetical protein